MDLGKIINIFEGRKKKKEEEEGKRRGKGLILLNIKSHYKP